MKSRAEKTPENKNQAAAQEVTQKQTDENSLALKENSPGSLAPKNLLAMANNSPKAKQLKALQQIADNSPQAKQAAQLQAAANHYLAQRQSVIGKTNIGKPERQLLQKEFQNNSNAPVQRVVAPGLDYHAIVKVNYGANQGQLARILLPYTNPGNTDERGYFTSSYRTGYQTSYLYSQLDPAVIPELAMKMEQDAYKVAIVGEQHNEYSKIKERAFWDNFGVQLVYESGSITIEQPGAASISVQPDNDALRLFSMWQDMQERMVLLNAVFQPEKLAGKGHAQDVRAATNLKDFALKFFSYSKEIIAFDVPEGKAFMDMLILFQSVVAPVFGRCEALVGAESIDIMELCGMVKLLDGHINGLKTVCDPWIEALGTSGLKGKTYKQLTTQRSIGMLSAILKNSAGMNRVVYKVGENHLLDMLHLAEQGIELGGVKLIPRAAYNIEMSLSLV
jgi:hypothetical protein